MASRLRTGTESWAGGHEDPRLPVRLLGGYYPAVDGMRALAILSILIYHAGLYHNGLFGVDVFFVLSGFLITVTSLREWHRTGFVHLGRFYLRRLKRLLPGLLVVLALTGWAVVEYGTRAQVDRFRFQALASLLYAANWEQIATGASYWDGYEAINPLGHLWSLAITEQFYLVWPLVLLAALCLGRRRLGLGGCDHQWRSGRVWLLTVVAAAGWLVASAQPFLRFDGTNADRMYLGADTHVQGLLAGAAAAGLVHLVNLRRSRAAVHGAHPQPPGAGRRWLVTTGSVALLAAIVVLSIRADGYRDPWLYEWGIAAVAVLASAFAASLTSEANLLGRVLAATWLVEIGKVSYSLFLVHLPLYWVIQAVEPRSTPGDLVLLGVSGSLLAAGALHHLIAEPIRLRPWRRRGAVVFGGFLVATSAFAAAAPSVWTWSHQGRGDLEVLALGDSLANDFASAMGSVTGDVVRVEDAGIPGCGVSGAVRMRTAAGITQDAPARCNPWAERYRQALADSSPDAVVVNVSWDAVSLDLGDGEWTDLRDPATAAAYAEQLRELAEVTRAAGVPVLVANARPFNANMTPEQVAAFNALLTETIEQHPHLRLLDLAARVCTSTDCATTTASGEARYLDDRVHFSAAGKREVAPWLTGAIQGAVRAWDGEGFRE